MKYLCEYLSRLNSVAVCIESDENIQRIATSGSSIEIYSGKSRTINLGISVAPIDREPGACNVAFRIPTTEKQPKRHNWQFTVPWQAPFLREKSIACRECGQYLFTVKDSRQLPSEYWAELMEFWHCHKPQENTQTQKDYTLDPVPGRVLVSDTYLKVHGDDISELCSHISPFKIWKWQVSVDKELIEGHVFIASMLRELINSHAIFSFLLESDADTQKSILLWVVNVQAEYTITDSGPRTGLKVYFCTDPAEFPSLKATQAEIETVQLPHNIMGLAISELQKINAVLPKDVQNFQGWRLGFLGAE